MDNTTYYQRDREKILNKAKDYYKNENKIFKGVPFQNNLG